MSYRHWASRMAFLFYTLLLALALPVFIVKLIKIGPDSKTKRLRLLERFGIGLEKGRNGMLIHTVSVGEVVAAAPIVSEFLRQNPSESVTMTCSTAAGSERIQALFDDKVYHHYLPFDFLWCYRRLFNSNSFKLVAIFEMELWPNLFKSCNHFNIPTIILNGRMTERSAQRTRKFSWLSSPVFTHISSILCQSQRDVDGYLSLGVHPDKVILAGNIKFELSKSQDDIEQGKTFLQRFPEGTLLWVAGSTHAPEEAMLRQSFEKLEEDFPLLHLVIVPRHPQRFDEVAKLIPEAQRMSECGDKNFSSKLVIADVMGQLKSIYSAADLVFMGGSIAERGGHNPLEAAIYGKFILMGPHRQNNLQACDLLTAAGAVVEVSDVSSIEREMRACLSDMKRSYESGENGAKIVQQNSGALSCTIETLNTLLA